MTYAGEVAHYEELFTISSWRLHVAPVYVKESERGVNGYHDNLHRNVLIGRHIRRIVRNVAARQSVTGPIWDAGTQHPIALQPDALELPNIVSRSSFPGAIFRPAGNRNLHSDGSNYEDFFMISSWTLHIREVGFT
jgi:hypothetical protein